MLPAWAGRTQPKPVGFGFADSPHTAPGYRIVGDDFYTCIEPSGGPHVDPAVLRAIHEFDPSAVPVWRKQTYLPPGRMGEEHLLKVSHVGIARYKADRRSATEFHPEMPEGADFKRPNVLEFIWEDDAPALKNGGPGTVLPFDWGLYRYMRSRFNRNVTNKVMVKAWLDRTRERHEREARQSKEELAYRQNHLERSLRKTFESVTPEELMRSYLELRQQRRLRQAKTYVFRGGN